MNENSFIIHISPHRHFLRDNELSSVWWWKSHICPYIIQTVNDGDGFDDRGRPSKFVVKSGGRQGFRRFRRQQQAVRVASGSFHSTTQDALSNGQGIGCYKSNEESRYVKLFGVKLSWALGVLQGLAIIGWIRRSKIQ